MFFPLEMTEVEIIVPDQDIQAVTSALVDQGIFHEVDARYLSSGSLSAPVSTWRERSIAYAGLESRIMAISQSLEIDMSLPSSAMKTLMVDIEEANSQVEHLEKEVQQTVDEISKKQDQLKQLETYTYQLKPLADVDIELGAMRNSHYVFSLLGIMPTNKVERFKESLERIPFVLLNLRRDDHQSVVMLLSVQNQADILERAARSAYLNPLTLPEAYTGTPIEIINALQNDITHTQQSLAKLKNEISNLRNKHEQKFRTLLWQIRVSRIQTDAIARFGKLRSTYIIVGWVPSRKLTLFKRLLQKISESIIIESYPAKRDEDKKDVPVRLGNSRFLSIFQPLVTAYGRPRYEELDPTFLIAITFPLLFGTMFGDVGHGLVLALLGTVLFSQKVKPLRSLAAFGPVLMICGFVASAFGFLYGSIFGFEDVLTTIWIQPIKNIMQILIVSIVAGIVLLSVGFIIGILNALIARDWGRLLFSKNGIAGLVLYWSLIGIAVKAFVPGMILNLIFLVILALIGGIAVMFSEFLEQLVRGDRSSSLEGGFGTYIIQAFFELFEALISDFSNTLSYVRVGAFAVAHGGLSAVIFILAGMVSPTQGVGYWIVVALGNLFIIGFEGMIVGIQSLRLEYYEFFSKFFTGNGTSFSPLRIPSQQDQ